MGNADCDSGVGWDRLEPLTLRLHQCVLLAPIAHAPASNAASPVNKIVATSHRGNNLSKGDFGSPWRRQCGQGAASSVGVGSGRLLGKSAVVTGAAAGIGGATSELFAGEGARLVLADINTEGLSTLRDSLANLTGDVAVVTARGWSACHGGFQPRCDAIGSG